MYIHETVMNFGFQRRKDLMQPFCDGETRVLVCTDLASRGIDHDKVILHISSHHHIFLSYSLIKILIIDTLSPILQVNHVVLLDFPHTILDYLHRVGRTGRVGSSAAKCRASILMTHRNDVRIAWQIKVGNMLFCFSCLWCRCLTI